MIREELAAWIAAAPDEGQRELRRAVHTILAAVATAPNLPKLIFLKGGILIALNYAGDRFTRDVDFSVRERLQELDPEQLVAELKAALTAQVEALDYGLDCRVQGHELKPTGAERTWPTLKVSVGYAPKADNSRHRRLQRGGATTTVSVDISYNEVITAVEVVEVPGAGPVQGSTLADLVAEKLRAMLQQPGRRRSRRQDVYDLYRLLERPELTDPAIRSLVLAALQAKSQGRGVPVEPDGLRNPEVRRRSLEYYALLADEITTDLPEFDEAYRAVQAFYEDLPWSENA